MNYLEIIKQEINSELKKISIDLNLPEKEIDFTVEIPELEHGDATTNVCLISTKVLKLKPEEVFNKLKVDLENIKIQNINIFEKIEFKNPGFINFYFTKKFVLNTLNSGSDLNIVSEKYNDKKVLVEHTSINLFKPFTVGHLLSNFTGEFIFRSLKAIGANTLNLSYPSDISIGIAKAVYIIKQDGGLSQDIFKKDVQDNLDTIIKYLGESYVRGVNSFKNWEENKNNLQDSESLEKINEVKRISTNLYENISGEDLEIYNFTKKINLDYFNQIITGLGSEFDGFIFESEAGVVGKKIVLENTGEVGEGFIFQKSEGAIVYIPSGERKDINTSVFINSENNPTYLAKDIGLLSLKFEKYSPLDYSIYVVDNEQNSHFKSVFDAAGKINKEWQEKSIHVPHGRMTFKGQKMSSRLGNVPTAQEVVDIVLEEVKEKSKKSTDKLESFTEDDRENLQKEIALSALRISMLRSKPGVNIDFDPEKATSFEGDSGPYLCYTHARCCSLLEKSKLPHQNLADFTIPSKKGEESATNIERKVLQYSNILKISAEEMAPQKLVKYLFELSGEFNNFYANNKILKEIKNEEDKKGVENNLYIVYLVKKTLKDGLYILGINAPEKM